MIEKAEASQHYFNAVKTRAGTTTKFVGALLFVLFLVWRQSLTEAKSMANNAITSLEKEAYLDHLISIRNNLYKEIKTEGDGLGVRIRTNNKDNLPRQIIDSAEQNIKAKKTTLSTSIAKLGKKKSAVQEMTKAYMDSLKVEFDIPTLKPVKERVRVGTLVWMLLFNICLFLITTARKEILASLDIAFATLIRKERTSIREINKMHIPLPFWAYPIHLRKSTNPAYTSASKNLVAASKPNVPYATITVLFFLAIMVDIWILNWRLNTRIYDEWSKLFLTASVVLFICALIFVVNWFFVDNKIGLQDFSTAAFSIRKPRMYNRQEFLLLSSPVLLSLLFASPITQRLSSGTSSPWVKKTIRKRSRNNSIKENPVQELKPGFYVNGKNVVHYVSGKNICMSLKNIAPQNKKAFFKNLRPFALQSLYEQPEKYALAFGFYAFRNEVEQLIAAKAFDEAAGFLNKAIFLAEQKYMTGRVAFYEHQLRFLENSKGAAGNKPIQAAVSQIRTILNSHTAPTRDYRF